MPTDPQISSSDCSENRVDKLNFGDFETEHWMGEATSTLTQTAVKVWKRAKKAGLLPAVDECILGDWFVDKVLVGELVAYPLQRPSAATLAKLPPTASELWRLSDRAWHALALVIAANCLRNRRGTRSKGLLMKHKTMAIALGCCTRTAGTTMRLLVRCNLISSSPWFDSGSYTNAQLSNCYRLTPFAIALLGLSRPRRVRPPSKPCQPEKSLLRKDPEERGVVSPAATSIGAAPAAPAMAGREAARAERTNRPTSLHALEERVERRVSEVWRSRFAAHHLATEARTRELERAAEQRAADNAKLAIAEVAAAAVPPRPSPPPGGCGCHFDERLGLFRAYCGGGPRCTYGGDA